ncbi:MAG: DUF1957 domain-containing protein [Verrucomicrobia bacterium]|nr:MAG: DUF1957 domain-containing protein [Verrucomicrobiota bacterium]
MPGYLAIVLHAHLPFVRHPEHEKFLEESWLYEAVAECYLPLLQMLRGWQRDNIPARLTLTLSPTLCAMLRDPLLQERTARHLDSLVALAEKEIRRTEWDRAFQPLARMYHGRFSAARELFAGCQRDLVGAFRELQNQGRVEIITTAATHAVLPLLAAHPASLRAQVLTACDQYRECFGCEPRGFWLPECAYDPAVEACLQEANLRWFVADTHGVLHAQPRPQFGVFAPVFTPNGLAVFGRDPESSRQVWSSTEGYPGDPHYRDFYRDAGFDLDFDYVKPHLPAPEQRGFTGLKYFRITGGGAEKAVYDPVAARQRVEEHARHFLRGRLAQVERVAGAMDRPPLIVAPYDAELFGHWWHEGPDFLDQVARKAAADNQTLRLITPTDYLRQHPTNQVVTPGASTWGEGGHLRVWLNDRNEWIYPHLQAAQERMTELARRFAVANELEERALKQAARELVLAQASDWPFILRTGTSPEYARGRVKEHLLRFLELHEQLVARRVDAARLAEIEARDNCFADVNPRYWA